MLYVNNPILNKPQRHQEQTILFGVLGRCLHSMNVPNLWYYTTHVANCLSY